MNPKKIKDIVLLLGNKIKKDTNEKVRHEPMSPLNRYFEGRIQAFNFVNDLLKAEFEEYFLSKAPTKKPRKNHQENKCQQP